MPITAYNDIYFLVDNNGIQKIFGSIYDIIPKEIQNDYISLQNAIDILESNISEIDFGEKKYINIGRISLEYIVTNSKNGEVLISPAWRFEIGRTDDELNLMRDTIIAVDAVSGSIIQGKRGNTF